MITVKDQVNLDIKIKVGNVVEITNELCPYIDKDTPLKAIVIYNGTSYQLLNMYTFKTIGNKGFNQLNDLINAFGLVFYSNNIELIIK